jgi:CheY-like chemotaxis protein
MWLKINKLWQIPCNGIVPRRRSRAQRGKDIDARLAGPTFIARSRSMTDSTASEIRVTDPPREPSTDAHAGLAPRRRARPGGPQEAPVGRGAVVPGVRRPCVLVVDDEAHDREIYGRTLCYNGFDVVFAADGRSALNRAAQYTPDLVVLDVCLPDMSGLRVLGILRERPEFNGTPVIVLSGLSEDGLGGRARAAGGDRYIEKPASPVMVLHAVEDLIGKAPLPGVGVLPQVVEPA